MYVASEISGLDPALAFDESSLIVINQTYETLFEYHYLKRPYGLTPLLAAKMPLISLDRKTYTIELKKGIYYHDHPSFKGKKREMKAEDFINQIKRLAFAPLKSTGKSLFQGKIKGFDEFSEIVGSNFSLFFSTPITGLKVKNDYLLEIELNVPYPQLLYALAMSFVTPLPKEAIIYQKNDFDQTMVGTGPFVLNYQTNLSEFLFKRNPDYAKTSFPAAGDRVSHTKKLLDDSGKFLPLADELSIKVKPNEKERWQAFLDKKIDLIEVPQIYINESVHASGKLKRKYRKEGISLQVYPSFSGRWLAFNMNDPLLGKNVKLRKAIAYALNYDNYINMLTQRVAQRANSLLFPGVPGYDPTHKSKYNFNPDRAKILLAEAGFPDGKGLPIITYTTRGNNQKAINEAKFLVDSLAPFGIKIKINEVTFSEFLTLGRAGKLQFWTDGWIFDYPDAENLLQLLVSKNSPGVNKTGYKNTEVDQLYDQMLYESNLENKKITIKKIESIVEQDLPWIMIYYNRSYFMAHHHLKNFRYSSFIRNYVKYLNVR